MDSLGNNSVQSDVSLDLSKIDWNNLTPEQFSALNSDLIQKQKIAKQQERKKERSSGYVAIKLRGKVYSIKQTTFTRLKAMKSEKSRNKLIDQIILENNSIESL